MSFKYFRKVLFPVAFFLIVRIVIFIWMMVWSNLRICLSLEPLIKHFNHHFLILFEMRKYISLKFITIFNSFGTRLGCLFINFDFNSPRHFRNLYEGHSFGNSTSMIPVCQCMFSLCWHKHKHTKLLLWIYTQVELLWSQTFPNSSEWKWVGI